MKKTFIIIVLLSCMVTVVSAQQLAQVSQFFSNTLLYNPAVAGSKEVIPIMSNVRRQWMNIEDAPVTQTISGHGFVGDGMGLGAAFHNDATGPSRLTGLSFSAARHFPFKRSGDMTLSLGLSGQLFQYRIDLDKITFDVENDPVRLTEENSRLTPDASFGALLYGSNYYFGVSVPNLFQTKMDLFDIAHANENRLKRHYILIGEVDFELDDKTSLIPSFLGRYLPGAPVQVELNVRGRYSFGSKSKKGPFRTDAREKNAWLGVSYRTGDAVVAMVGVNYEFFNFGYSYDITTSNVRYYSKGTHEISLGMYLDNPLKTSGHKFY